MKVEYWIKDNEWKQVNFKAYDSFKGEKEQRPPKHLLYACLLIPLRFS